MPAQQDIISYEHVCTLVGRLFIEKEAITKEADKTIEELRSQVKELQAQLARAKQVTDGTAPA
jgi:hypothetical protein